LAELKTRKVELGRYYEEHYVSNAASSDIDAAAPTAGTSGSPLKLDFTSRYMEMDFGIRTS